MAIIKCRECGKDISDKASLCNGCGAPITIGTGKFGDFDGDGKIGFGDVVAAFRVIKDKVSSTTETAVEHGKELLKSKQQKDAEAIDKLTSGFANAKQVLETESELKCTMFKAALDSTIEAKFAEIMRGKSDEDKFLSFVDGKILTSSVRNIFRSALDVTPPQIEAACNLSEAILAPTSDERNNLIKTAVGVGGGATGIGMIIFGVGSALGWGAGIIASVSAFFVGTSVAGPIGWTVAGVTLGSVAAYFAATSNKHKDTERFLNVLKNSSSRAVDAIWPQYEEQLTKALNSESSV